MLEKPYSHEITEAKLGRSVKDLFYSFDAYAFRSQSTQFNRNSHVLGGYYPESREKVILTYREPHWTLKTFDTQEGVIYGNGSYGQIVTAEFKICEVANYRDSTETDRFNAMFALMALGEHLRDKQRASS